MNIKWYHWVIVAVLFLTTLVLLAKTYAFFNIIFSIFYDTHFSIIALILGFLAIASGIFMMVESVRAHKWYREIIEGLIVIIAGLLLLSPEFNTVLDFGPLAIIQKVPTEVVSHVAVALVPIIIVSILDLLFRKK